MKFTELLDGIGNPIAFFPDLIPITGSPNAALFLCQLTYWTGKQHNPDGWIYKTQEEWCLETGLSEKEQRTARRPLVERGYVEERERGIPSRLEYRLVPSALKQIWDIWTIASNVKKQFETLCGTYGVLLSRGIQYFEMQQQMENFRSAIRQCHQVTDRFFDQCRQLKVTPYEIADSWRENLTKVAETLARPTNSQRAVLDTPNGQYKKEPMGSTSSDEQAVQVATDGSLPHTPSPKPSTVLDPSEITEKTTQENPQNIRSGAEKICIENDYQVVSILEVEVLKETQQETKDQEIKSQGQQNILMGINIPGGAGFSPEKENIPIWVQESEDKVRLGATLPRPELVKLAEYRLGAYATLYRHSGRVMDANPNDMKPEFIAFLQWHSFNGSPAASHVVATVRKFELEPERWGVLLSWLQTWQEVVLDPRKLETMLEKKVGAAGKNANPAEMTALNRRNFKIAMEKR